CDFEASSSDNCTAQQDLRYSFSPDEIVPSMIFTCDDIAENGSPDFSVSIWVWDEWGNTAECVNVLSIQDNMGICDEMGLSSITGIIETPAGEPVAGVMTYLDGHISDELMTGSDGNYHF